MHTNDGSQSSCAPTVAAASVWQVPGIYSLHLISSSVPGLHIQAFVFIPVVV